MSRRETRSRQIKGNGENLESALEDRAGGGCLWCIFGGCRAAFFGVFACPRYINITVSYRRLSDLAGIIFQPSSP